MQNFIFGFISRLLANFFTPHVGELGTTMSSLVDVVVECLIFGICLSLSSRVNGHDIEMFRRSKVDFFVNALIASIGGVCLAVLLMLSVRFLLVGRLVIFFAVIIYLCLVAACSWLGLIRAVDAVIVYSLVPENTKRDIDNMCQPPKQLKFLPLTGFVNSDNGFLDYRYFKRFYSRVYFVFARNVGDVSDSYIEAVPFKLRSRIVTLKAFFEMEYEIVDPDSEDSSYWWEVSTHLKAQSLGNFKRLLDLVLVGLLFFPAILVISVAGILVKLWDGGPIFYRQTRLGQYGREFSILKVRTMGVDSEKSGAQWATSGDKRITGIGRILRMTRIDELPQLWNIFCGEMSVVGPRPERPEFYSVIEKDIPKFRLRLACKPGLTGWAQVNYPYGASLHDARMKLLFDLYYLKNASFILELRVITRTVVAMVRGAR